MRSPDRIPVILSALERRWREEPDMRLGQLLMNLDRRSLGEENLNPLFALEDDALLTLLGLKTEAERRIVREEPVNRRRGMQEGFRGLGNARDVER